MASRISVPELGTKFFHSNFSWQIPPTPLLVVPGHTLTAILTTFWPQVHGGQVLKGQGMLGLFLHCRCNSGRRLFEEVRRNGVRGLRHRHAWLLGAWYEFLCISQKNCCWVIYVILTSYIFASYFFSIYLSPSPFYPKLKSHFGVLIDGAN